MAVLSTFGSRPADAAVAVAIAAALTGTLYVVRESAEGRDHVALAGGLLYALVCVAVYGVPRYLLDAFVPGVFAPQNVVWVLVFVIPLVVAQGALPVYLFLDRDVLGALLGLFLATVVTLWALLAVGGESDILIAYPWIVAPLALGMILLGVVADVTVRALGGLAGG